MRIVAIVLFQVAALAQSSSGPAFEVASVKPSATNQRSINNMFTYPGGRIACSGCTLQYLAMEAFDAQPYQITGGPGWLSEDRFDVEAIPPASSEASKANPRLRKLPPNAEQRRMLQSLLADRFQLKWRREAKDGPVYFLLKTDKKLKLQEPADKDAYPWVGGPEGGAIMGGGIAATNASMPLLAARLSRYLEHPVIDKTGIDGAFDFRFEYHPDGGRPDIISCILTSVEGLGLKLQAGRGPVETLIVEGASKPSVN